MRKYLLAAIMAASALVPAAAFADDHRGGQHEGGGENRGGGQQRGDGGQRPAPAQQPQQQQQARPPQVQAQQPQARQGVPMRYQRPNTDGNNRPQFQGGRPDTPQQAYQGDRNGNGGGWQQGGDRGNQPRPGGNVGQGSDPRRDDRGGNWQQGGDRGNPPRAGGNGWQGNDPRRDDRGGNWQQGQRNNQGQGYRGNGWNGRDNGGRDWSRNWRQDNRYNYYAYRNNNRNAFHLPRYYAPGGWGYGYRRFGIGLTLDSILYDQGYWIDQPDYYRLPPAYGPYRWVRYYNDALLVDIYTGRVVDTVYDIFW